MASPLRFSRIDYLDQPLGLIPTFLAIHCGRMTKIVGAMPCIARDETIQGVEKP
jgi:hypothetical protein